MVGLAVILADGRPDTDFGEGGIAGEASPIRYVNRYGWEGPEALRIRSDGKFFVAGPRNLGYPTPQGVVRLYNPDGSFAEVAGFVPESGPPPLFQSVLSSLALEADGSVAARGSAFVKGGSGYSLLLGKLVPGSGTPFDPIVRRRGRPGSRGSLPVGAWIGNRAGRRQVGCRRGGRRHVMLARFDDKRGPDPSFGEGGYAVPAIEGTSGGLGTSEARSVAVQGDGGLIVAGKTTKWSPWTLTKSGQHSCEECAEPLVARFISNGALDTSFGVGGVVRLTTSSGKPLLGGAEQVVSLADGKILVQGSVQMPGLPMKSQFLTRLNADGSLDRSFGDGGLVRVRPLCMEKSLETLRRKGCIPAARIRFRAAGLSGARPTLSLRVKPSLPWARIATVRVQLPQRCGRPPALRTRRGCLRLAAGEGAHRQARGSTSERMWWSRGLGASPSTISANRGRWTSS